MENAIASFAALKADKKMVILGDMLELGSESAHGHAAVIRQLRNIGDIRAVLVGPLFREAAADFPPPSSVHQRLLPARSQRDPKATQSLSKDRGGIMLEKVFPLL